MNKYKVNFRAVMYDASYSEFSIGEGQNYLEFTIKDGELSCRTSTNEGHIEVEFAVIHSAICRVINARNIKPKSTPSQKSRFTRRIEEKNRIDYE